MVEVRKWMPPNTRVRHLFFEAAGKVMKTACYSGRCAGDNFEGSLLAKSARQYTDRGPLMRRSGPRGNPGKRVL